MPRRIRLRVALINGAPCTHVTTTISPTVGYGFIDTDPELRRRADEVLKATKEAYGFIPVVNQVLSERPDMFLPAAEYAHAVLEGDGALEQKQRYLCAIAAATAVGGEYCVKAQATHAIDAGATRDEILEAMTIGSYMAMSRAQSYAYRKYAELFGVKLE